MGKYQLFETIVTSATGAEKGYKRISLVEDHVSECF